MTPIDPARAEVEAEPVQIEWEGQTLSLPATADDWEWDTLTAFENDRASDFLPALFGAETFAKIRREFEKSQGRTFRLKDGVSLMTAVARAYGFLDAGE